MKGRYPAFRTLVLTHAPFQYSIFSPEKIQRFSEKRVIALLVFYPTVQVIIWYFQMAYDQTVLIVFRFFLGILFTPTDDAESLEIVRNAIKEEYNITVLEGYLILHHWVLTPSCAVDYRGLFAEKRRAESRPDDHCCGYIRYCDYQFHNRNVSRIVNLLLHWHTEGNLIRIQSIPAKHSYRSFSSGKCYYFG